MRRYKGMVYFCIMFANFRNRPAAIFYVMLSKVDRLAQYRSSYITEDATPDKKVRSPSWGGGGYCKYRHTFRIRVQFRYLRCLYVFPTGVFST